MANIDPWSVFQAGGEIPLKGEGSIDREMLRDKYSARNRLFWNQTNQSGTRKGRDALSYKSPNLQLDPAVQYRVVGDSAFQDFLDSGLIRGNWDEQIDSYPANFFSQGVPLYSYGETALSEGRKSYLLATLGEGWGDRSVNQLYLSDDEKKLLQTEPNPYVTEPFTAEEKKQLRALQSDIRKVFRGSNTKGFNLVTGETGEATLPTDIFEQDVQKAKAFGIDFENPNTGLAKAREAGIFKDSDALIEKILQKHQPIIQRINSSFGDFEKALQGQTIPFTHPMAGWMDFFKKGNRSIQFEPNLWSGLTPEELDLTAKASPFYDVFGNSNPFYIERDKADDVISGKEYGRFSLRRYPAILDRPEVQQFLDTSKFRAPNTLEPEFPLLPSTKPNSLAGRYGLDRLTPIARYPELVGINPTDLESSLRLLMPSQAGYHYDANFPIINNFFNKLLSLHGSNAPMGEPNPLFTVKGFEGNENNWVKFQGARLQPREDAFAANVGINLDTLRPFLDSQGHPPYLPLNYEGQPLEARIDRTGQDTWKARYPFAPKGSWFDYVQPQITKDLVRLGAVDDESASWKTPEGIQRYLDKSFFVDTVHNRGAPIPLMDANVADQGRQGAMQSERLPRGEFFSPALNRTINFPAHSINTYSRPTVIFEIDPTHPQGLKKVFELNNNPLPTGELPIPTKPLSQEALTASSQRFLGELEKGLTSLDTPPPQDPYVQLVEQMRKDQGFPSFLDLTDEEKARQGRSFSEQFPEVSAALQRGEPVGNFDFRGTPIHLTDFVRETLNKSGAVTDKDSFFGLRNIIDESTRGSPNYGKKGFLDLRAYLGGFKDMVTPAVDGEGMLKFFSDPARAAKFAELYRNNPDFTRYVNANVGSSLLRTAGKLGEIAAIATAPSMSRERLGAYVQDYYERTGIDPRGTYSMGKDGIDDLAGLGILSGLENALDVATFGNYDYWTDNEVQIKRKELLDRYATMEAAMEQLPAWKLEALRRQAGIDNPVYNGRTLTRTTK